MALHDTHPASGADGSALLVIDMQNMFCHPDGAVTKLVGPLHEIDVTVDNVSGVIEKARVAHRPVIFTRHCYDANYVSAGRNFPGPNPIGVTGAELMEHGAFIAGTWGSDVLDVLDRRDGDVMIDKTRYDAFLGTQLESILHNLGVRRLDVCGVVTNICVESTTRAAFMRDFECTVFAACTTAGTGELHENALGSLDAGKFATIAGAHG